jgi:hypothetical protein
MGKYCRPDLRLWLSVVIIRSAIRMASRLYVASLMTEVQGVRNGNSKFVDILDVFGIVWFAVGNLLVFNNFGCIDISPIVFFTSLLYIVLSYISFFTPSIIRCTLGICRPTAEDDLAYLRQTADADREAAFIGRHGGVVVGRAAELTSPSRLTNPDLTPERARYWADWLQTYGCYEVVYHPAMDFKGQERRRRQQVSDEQVPTALPPGDVTAGHGNHPASQEPAGGDIEMGSAAVDVSSPASPPGQGQSQSQRREYVNVPTGGTDSGGHPLWDEEGDFCAVCLLPFEAPPSGVDSPLGQALTSPDEAAGSSSSVPERNWVVVRYPCQGHHYFHAHCLHSWLQVCSARYLNARRVPRGGETDHHLQVTCPCCRELPRSLLGEGERGEGVQREEVRPASQGGVRSAVPGGTSGRAYELLV